MSKKKPDPQPAPPGRFAYERLDRVFHEKARLGILTSLLAHPSGLLFNDLKEVCALTDGNLNRHLAVLQEAGLIDIKKTNQARPQSIVAMTATGRKRFQEYIAVLESVVADALQNQQQAAAAKASRPKEGWSTA